MSSRRRRRAATTATPSASSSEGSDARGRGPRKPADERKDHLIQARVPRELDDVLKKEAKRRRLSVSHLIRNVLEDTYKLVDGVISEVDNIVHDSVQLGGLVHREAREIARAASALRTQSNASAPAPKPAEKPAVEAVEDDEDFPDENDEDFEDAEDASAADKPQPAADAAFEQLTADVYAWNPVVLHRPAQCVRCSSALDRGATANLGLSQQPGAAPRWLCANCLAKL